jgi:hypothetical protein
MSIVDCITSFVDGRVRLRHPALKDKATAELVCTVVGGVDGITAVQANPVTGSLLIYYDAEKLTREQLLELAEQGAAFIPGMDVEGAPAEAAAVEESAEGAKRKACKACAPVDELLGFLTRRSTTKFIDRAMLVSIIASLAALPLGNRSVHTAAGGVFVGGLLQHLLAHRKAL